MQSFSLLSYTLIFSAIVAFASCKHDNVVKPSSKSTDLIESEVEEIEEIDGVQHSSNNNAANDNSKIAVKEKIVSEKVDKKSDTKKKQPVAKNKPKKKKPSKNKPRPVITFEEPFQDFGEIVEGDTVDFKFIFSNTGKAALDISSAIPTCGCTRPSFPFIPVEPGDKGYIGVQFISIGKEGDQNPTIEVNSNGSAEPVILTMSGFVKPKPEQEPVEIDTTEMKTGN